MTESPIDLDLSRRILVERDPVIQQMDANSLQLGNWIGQRIPTPSRQSLQKNESILLLISAMGLASLLAALEEALRKANLAMNQAKQLGDDRIVAFDRDLELLQWRRQAIKKGLENALAKSEFYLCSQPQLHLETGVVIGAEALVRWRHGELGQVSPVDFIPIAEDDGLIVEIGS